LQCLVLTIPPVDSLESLIDLLAEHAAELTDPLTAAAGVDNIRAITRLLDRGANIEGDGVWSPLEEALYWGNEDSVSLLLKRGARVRNLRTAAALGNLEKMRRCFDDTGGLATAAGEVAWPFGTPIPDSIRKDPQQILANALVYAAAWNQSEAVERLLNRGAQINLIPAGFDFAGTPLHYAALRGHRGMVNHLLQQGARADIRDTKVDKLPEDWAAHVGHGDLAAHLRQVRHQNLGPQS